MACNMLEFDIRQRHCTRDLSCNLMASALSAASFFQQLVDKALRDLGFFFSFRILFLCPCPFLSSLSSSLSNRAHLLFIHRTLVTKIFSILLNSKCAHKRRRRRREKARAKRLKGIFHSLAFNENPISIIMEVCSATEITIVVVSMRKAIRDRFFFLSLRLFVIVQSHTRNRFSYSSLFCAE